MKCKILFLLSGALLLNACSDESSNTTQISGVANKNKSMSVSKIDRWYSFSQVSKGNVVFQKNCASCHKADASGTKDWKKTDAQGRYPAPPLNGDAHTWHHPMKILRRTVKNGGVALGGWMPAFKETLNDQEIDNVLAWVQSHWNDEVYTVWNQRNKQAGGVMQPLKN